MKRIARKATVGTVATAVLVGTLGLTATTASADPYRPIVVVGSNTIEDLYNGYGNGFPTTIGGTFHGATFTPSGVLSMIASYDSVGTASIQTNADKTQFTRPNGSGAGRKALSGAWDDLNHAYAGVQLQNSDVTMSRSSSKTGKAWAAADKGTTANQESFIPLGRDAVGVAEYTPGGVTAIANFTLPQLEALYGAKADATNNPTANLGLYTQVTGQTTIGDIVASGSGAAQVEYIVTASGNVPVQPVFAQHSSGTNQFFSTAINAALSSSGTSDSFGAWVKQSDSWEENTANVISSGTKATPNAANSILIVPFSGAAAVAQNNGLATDTGLSTISFPTVGGSALFTGSGASATPGALYGSTTVQPTYVAGDFTRDVYTVVPTSQLTTTYGGISLQTLATNLLVTQKDSAGGTLVADYGFKAFSTTYTSNTSHWFESPYEH